jgi:hypothetical protein
MPVFSPYGFSGTDTPSGGFSSPPAVDWHCVPANLNVRRASLTQQASSLSLVPHTYTPRLGAADTLTALTLGSGQHAVVGDVSVVVPPVAVEADLLTNGVSVHLVPSISAPVRAAWLAKFDDPFAAWQLVATGWPTANALGVFGTATTQHMAPASYATQSQADLKTTPWPVPGTFRYLTVVTKTNPSVSAGPILTLGLEVGGVESIMVTTPTITSGNLTNLMLDTTTDVHVDAGDLVQFVARRTNGGTGSQINSGTRWYCSIGFLPD